MWRVKLRVERVWLLAMMSGMFVVGVMVAPVVQAPWWVGVVGIFGVAASFWASRMWSVPIICVAGAAVGLGFGGAQYAARLAYEPYFGRTIELAGVLEDDVSKTGSGATSLQVGSVKILEAANGRTAHSIAVPGTLLVMTRAPTTARRSDSVIIRGQLEAGFGSFAATMRLATILSVEAIPYSDMGRDLRDWFTRSVRRVVPEPQASLGIGFLTGQKSSLPDELSSAMKVVGLTHIVVASGYNVTVLVHMARKLFRKLSKFLSAAVSVSLIVAFVGVAGLSPSMSRAAFVSVTSLMAWYYGRSLSPFILLLVAAAVTVALRPSYAWGDIGWQLSFAAFAGVMIVSPLVHRYFFGNEEGGALRQVLGETIAAHVVTMPVIAMGFGTTSNIAIVSNLLVVPLVPLGMLLTFLSGLWVSLGIGFPQLIAAPTSWLLGYMVQVSTFLANIPWAQTTIPTEWWVWALYTGGVIGGCFFMWRKSKTDVLRFSVVGS